MTTATTPAPTRAVTTDAGDGANRTVTGVGAGDRVFSCGVVPTHVPQPAFAGAVDCHTHLLPERLTRAIREALAAEMGWSFPHPADPEAAAAVVREAGVASYVVLPYAHRPGVARELNEWVLRAAADDDRAVPFATVHAGDDDPRAVAEAAFDAGARGLKFQCPVQGFGPADPRIEGALAAAAARDRPALFHAGTAPASLDSPHVGVDAFETVVRRHPDLRVACAHLGTYDWPAFVDLARDHDTVFLDTAFACSPTAADAAAEAGVDYAPGDVPDAVFEELAGQVMYGSDYPNVPHSYADERRSLLARSLSDTATEQLFRGAAARFLGR